LPEISRARHEQKLGVLREDVPLEEAKARIKAYFELHHGEIFDYADLMDELCIPLPSIVDACRELEQEGKIAGVD
jgi:hypothetical protein